MVIRLIMVMRMIKMKLTYMCATASDSCEYDMEKPTLTGKVLSKFVIKIMAKVGLKI